MAVSVGELEAEAALGRSLEEGQTSAPCLPVSHRSHQNVASERGMLDILSSLFSAGKMVWQATGLPTGR